MKKLLSLFTIIILLFTISCKDENTSGAEGAASPPENEIGGVYNDNIEPQDLKNELQNSNFRDSTRLGKFYSEKNFSAAWSKKANRAALISALENAESEGLSPEDYHLSEVKELSEQNLNQSKTARFDLLLTDAFLSYAYDLFYGKLDPKKLHEIWGIKREDKNLEELLADALDKGEIAPALDNLKPRHQVYEDLKLSLQEYRELKDTEAPATTVPEGKLIRPGETDERLTLLRTRLQELGFFEDTTATSDHVYSEELQQAVKEFQRERGLNSDGLVGTGTISELNKTAADRYDQILVNLERWRWYPRTLGDHYVLVNIADFKLAVVKEGDTVRQHKVVVGVPGRETPIFSDTLQYIVVNPEWHIPPTIKNKDIIPKAAKNPAYLTDNNISVYANGAKIDPAEVDWSSAQGLDFVQAAGPTNPLGKVKIIYPNKYLIYLHDTPAQNLFDLSHRASSSGCVRVENAIDLAAYVVEDLLKEKLQEMINAGKTKQVKINRPIQVHHLYWTAWRAGDKTVFATDVYGLDEKISSRLKAD